MQENMKSDRIDVTSSLTVQEELEEVFEPKQAKKSARVFEGIVTSLEDKMFERMSEIEKRFEKNMSSIEERFERSLRKDRIVLAIGLAGIALAILFH